jgi:hypothetical protein
MNIKHLFNYICLMPIKIFRFLPILIFVIFFSCRKDTVTNWDIDFTGPVVTSKLNIKNFLGDSLFSTSNNVLNLSYNREIAYIKLDSLIKLPDTTIVNQFLWPSPFPSTLNPNQTINLLPPTPLTFNISNGVALKYGIIRKGILNIKFSNSIAEPLDFRYILPGIKKNNQPFTVFETIPPGENSLVKSYELNGYDIDFTSGGLAAFNTIIQNYTVSLNSNAQPAEITFGKGAKAEISYSEIIPEYAYGYFGQQSVTINTDTANLNIFQNFNAVNLQLNDARLDFRIINEFGAEFSGSLNNIKSINTIKNNSVSLNTQQLNSININRAYQVNKTINPSVKFISLTKNNSNILPFLSNLPNKITYGGNININPLGNTSGFQDFAFYNTGIKVLADIQIPLKFNADAFFLESNASIDFTNLKQLDNVNYGTFIISAKNGYPFDAELQAYMVDGNNIIIDSLFNSSNNTIPKGIIDAQNIVLSPQSSKLYIAFDNVKLQNLKRSKNMKIKARLNMPPNPPEITIRENYEIDIDIIIDVNYKVRRN